MGVPFLQESMQKDMQFGSIIMTTVFLITIQKELDIQMVKFKEVVTQMLSEILQHSLLFCHVHHQLDHIV